MRILIIRHADPFYEIDSLTTQGWKEAELLSDKLAKLPITDFYVSPLGRAKDTASLTMKKIKEKAVLEGNAQQEIQLIEHDWLREFPPQINRPDNTVKKSIVWDWLPQDWTQMEEYFRRDLWNTTDIMTEGNVKEQYDYVIRSFDQLLAEHGYVRDGEIYRAERANKDILAFFCHFGLESVLLSRLMNVSPMILWHHTCAAPSSVTSLYTEERRKGIAAFRMNAFGDVSHLYAAGEEPSFSARFCEVWEDMSERHD